MTERDHNGAILFQEGPLARIETLGRANASADSWDLGEGVQETSEQGLWPLRDTGKGSPWLKKCMRFRNLIVKNDFNIKQALRFCLFSLKRQGLRKECVELLNSL